jgi:Leucine-rich repeat (LRR) protein
MKSRAFGAAGGSQAAGAGAASLASDGRYGGGRERNAGFFAQARVDPGIEGVGSRQTDARLVKAGAGARQQGGKSYMKQARQTGQINLSNRNIEVCPRDIFFIDDDLDPDEKYWEVVPITKLDLSHNSIRVLPDDIERLSEALTSLKLRYNSLVEIPEGLYLCTQLRHLDLAMNRICHISDAVGKLPFLRDLLLGCNEITTLPESLVSCTSLQVLELQENKLRMVGSQICIPSLLQLNLSSNQLTELPDVISSLVNLTSLQCKKNNILKIPDLRNLQKLSFLDVSENRIEQFPVLPQGHSSLDRLFLGCNRIRTIPVGLLVPHQSACLTELHLSDNSLSEIPYEMGLLACCKVLDFANNSISDIPASIGWMTSLQRFGAEGNPIRSIRRTVLTQSTVELKNYLRTRGPPAGSHGAGTSLDEALPDPSASHTSTGAFHKQRQPAVKSGGFEFDPFDPDLQIKDDDIFMERIRSMHSNSLDLSKLSCSDLPPGLIHKLQMSHAFDSETMTLGGIFRLNLSDNNLQRIPGELLTQLPQLSELNLSNNNLGASRPSGAVALFPASLRLLDVSKCKLQSSHLLMLVLCCQNVRELRAGNNAIDAIPSELNSHMNQLRELKLNNNALNSIATVDFSCFPALEIVDFTDNRIADLSPLMTSLGVVGGSRMTTILLDNNNIRDVPPLLCRFQRLQHLGLHGNPQKTIRSNQMTSVDAVMRALANKVTESDEAYYRELQRHQVPPAEPRTAGVSGPALNECRGKSQQRPRDDYSRAVESSSTVVQNGIRATSEVSETQSQRIKSIGQSLPPSGQSPRLKPSSWDPPGRYSQVHGIPVSSSKSEPRLTAFNSTPSEEDMEISNLRGQIAVLEKEMDDLSLSVTRKQQVKRTLALNRALLLKLTK